MKNLPFIIVLVFAVTSCQKETPKELEAILQNEILQEQVREIAAAENVAVDHVTADRSNPDCSGILFTDALANFVEENQEKANEACTVVKGFVSGCLDGYVTYGSALVFPTLLSCANFKRHERVHHSR